MQAEQGWFEAIRDGTLGDVQRLLDREGRGFLNSSHEEECGGFRKTWTPLGVALERGEAGSDIAVLLLANGAEPARTCATCARVPQPVRPPAQTTNRPSSFGCTLSTAVFGPFDAGLQSAREGLLEQYRSDVASGAFQPIFHVPPALVEGLNHWQWSRRGRAIEDDDDDFEVGEARTNYELNALGCALCFGYTIDLLAALMIAGADENGQGCVLDGRRCTPRQLAQENHCETDLTAAWEIVRDGNPAQAVVGQSSPPVSVRLPTSPNTKKSKVAPPSFKVMTWNIRTLGHRIDQRDYDQIASLLCARDISCVQETKNHGLDGNAGPLFRAMSDRGFA
jgi:hypothetical protein